MKNVKHCCNNCHFLNKSPNIDRAGEANLTWNKEDRAKLNVQDHYTASCWRGIWDTRIDQRLNSQFPVLLTRDRRDECFFIEHYPGMSYDAATELHRIRNDNRQLKKSYKYTQIALWIAVAGVVANSAYNVITDIFLMPPCPF